MKIFVTGSSGHLGEALVNHFRSKGDEVVGLDVVPAPGTSVVGSICDPLLVAEAAQGADAILHTATLHKPHVATHPKCEFITTNVLGTQILLDAAVKAKVGAFVFTSTTSTFGHAMAYPEQTAAVWVTEELVPIPKNIYGATKLAAEDLCQLAHQDHHLPCIVLRTSRFFPEEDDMKHTLEHYSQENIQAIEFLNRRVAIEDVVSAHEQALSKAQEIGFGKYIISATTPFSREDCVALHADAPAVLAKYYRSYERVFKARGWRMFPTLGRVYDNAKARQELGWCPAHSFGEILERVANGQPVLGPTAAAIGQKGYHR